MHSAAQWPQKKNRENTHKNRHKKNRLLPRILHLLQPPETRALAAAPPTSKQDRRTEDVQYGKRTDKKENQPTSHRETSSHDFDAPSRGATRSKGSALRVSFFLSFCFDPVKGVPAIFAFCWGGRNSRKIVRKIQNPDSVLAGRLLLTGARESANIGRKEKPAITKNACVPTLLTQISI